MLEVMLPHYCLRLSRWLPSRVFLLNQQVHQVFKHLQRLLRPQKQERSPRNVKHQVNRVLKHLASWVKRCHSVPGSLQDHPMTSLESNSCSQSATSMFQDSSTSLSPYSAKAVVSYSFNLTSCSTSH